MIGSFVVRLRAPDRIVLRGLGGEALHGLFFDVLKHDSPGMASKLHSLKDDKPLSVHPLVADCEFSEGNTIVPSGGAVSFRVAILEEELLNQAVSAFLGLMVAGRQLTLSGRPTAIESIDMSDIQLASFTTFGALAAAAKADPVVFLEFLTPVTFKHSGMHVTFPEPKLVFSSLLRRWNAFSQVPLPVETAETFESIMVSYYNLRTQLVRFSRYKVIGATGTTAYTLSAKTSEDFWRAVNTLANFAFYSGVGAKTAMGLGQTRRRQSKLGASRREAEVKPWES